MKKEKNTKDPITKLMCKKSFNTSDLEHIKRRHKAQERLLTLGLPVIGEIPVPNNISKDELLEFKIYYADGNYWINSMKYDFNLNQNELDEYFHNELITSRNLKLRKLKFIKNEN